MTASHPPTALLALLATFAVASLVHFIHNAEFVAEYPNMPGWLTRGGVYASWIGMTLVGAVGLVLYRRGGVLPGLAVIMVYALLGLDSLGHYVLAPMSAHTVAMNATILLEVTAAGLVLVEAVRLFARHASLGRAK